MTISETLVTSAPPLRIDATGVVRVLGSRVTLDIVIGEYWNGSTPEDIVSVFDSLGLADVYAILAYYLKNRQIVDEYLRNREHEAEVIRTEVESRSPMKDIRERLLAPARPAIVVDNALRPGPAIDDIELIAECTAPGELEDEVWFVPL